MIQIRKLIPACVLVLALPVAASAQPISISTTPSGSFTNSAGAAMAKVITEKTKVRAVIQAQAMQGQVPVDAGTADFGLSNSFDVSFYVTGTGEYQGQGEHKNIRLIASLTPYRVAMHVRADSDIKTLADLKGKRISSGFNAQKTIKRIIEAHLANAGLTYKDVSEVLTPNVSRSAEDFTAGRTDALFFAVGSAAVKQAAASVGGLKVLPIDASPDAVQRMETILPGSYVIEVKPSPTIDGISEPTKLVAFDMVFFANKGVPDETSYQVTKALHENKSLLAATFRPFNLFDPEQMAKPVKDLQFHPGALKYYREVGLMPKS
ncbi:MAG: TAXI family TRAP transporter solute-binding subunit [Xanthobacteraceae bacterium]